MVFGSLLELLEPKLGSFASTWELLGPTWGQVEPVLGGSGPTWAVLGAPGRQVGQGATRSRANLGTGGPSGPGGPRGPGGRGRPESEGGFGRFTIH